ncbi:MAG: 1-phosphofructokinase [Ignavibacteriales bacterium]|nr:1-phosphofructokinase [Ignavibacteriales bacterium]
MILIITLNPLLERIFTYEQVKFGTVNRNSFTKLFAGGKGLNVSRQLKKFGVKSYNYFFSGGTNGKLYRDLLKSDGIDFTFVSTKSETRHAAVVLSEKDKIVSSFFSEDPKISQTEVDEFKSKLDKMIQNSEIVIFSGSSPSIETDSIFAFGIELANRYDKVSICDTYGNHLQDCIDASPTIIHNNYSEIVNALSVNFDDEKSVIEFLNSLYKKNIKRVYLTNGSNNFYASNFNYIYKIKPLQIQEVDATGSGDSFVAGIVNSWINSDLFEESLKFSTATAGLNAKTFDISSVSKEDVILFKDKVEILPVGKKTKTIDDSPREI